jgi:hypothetical protein
MKPMFGAIIPTVLKRLLNIVQQHGVQPAHTFGRFKQFAPHFGGTN